MSAACTREGPDLVVHVTGDLDAATWEEPVAALAAALPTDAAAIVVDLGGVAFCDSSGIGSLVRLRTLAHEHRVPFTLRAVHPRVSRLLRLSGLDGVFGVKSVSAPSPSDGPGVGAG